MNGCVIGVGNTTKNE